MHNFGKIGAIAPKGKQKENKEKKKKKKVEKDCVVGLSGTHKFTLWCTGDNCTSVVAAVTWS